jgi:hypothetical protein
MTTSDVARIYTPLTDVTERKRKARTGPRWIRLSERRIGYRLSDILSWLDERSSA